MAPSKSVQEEDHAEQRHAGKEKTFIAYVQGTNAD
jgi:hypothetical protein